MSLFRTKWNLQGGIWLLDCINKAFTTYTPRRKKKCSLWAIAEPEKAIFNKKDLRRKGIKNGLDSSDKLTSPNILFRILQMEAFLMVAFRLLHRGISLPLQKSSCIQLKHIAVSIIYSSCFSSCKYYYDGRRSAKDKAESKAALDGTTFF